MSFIKRKEDLPRIAEVKRFMEYASFLPGFREEYRAAPNKTLLKYRLRLSPEDLASEEGPLGPAPKNPNGALARYIDFMTEKARWREGIRKECAPNDPAYAKWRERQTDRCIAAFPAARAGALVQEMVAFELSFGCSIGCPFCGLSAGKLSAVFRYTTENAILWNAVLDTCARVLGEGVGNATCYYGTEPLDNPDYERFIEDYRAHFGRYPQLTTAAGCRDIERTRALIAAVDPMEETVYRLSVRSRAEFDEIIRTFTPEELVLTELLAQYEAAPACSLIPVGRNAKEDDDYGDTIACVSGFLINLCERSIRLVTPLKASARFPNGQACLATEHFTDAASFEAKLHSMIGQMKNILSPNETLALYPWLTGEEREDAYVLHNEFDYHIDADIDRSRPVFRRVCELLMEGTHTRREIVAALREEFPEIDSAALFASVNILWNKGLIWDSQIFGPVGSPT